MCVSVHVYSGLQFKKPDLCITPYTYTPTPPVAHAHTARHATCSAYVCA